MTTLIIMIIYDSKNSNNNKNDSENGYNNNCHTKSENYALINFLLQSPPPPLHLHEYSDRASEGGKFEPCLSRAGNLNQKCQVFTAEVF